ncbi:hypothetical protein RRG08_017782 [Elysia crispata]|uniref:Uncharacterized protein n=1 Tax=Elysia crispata TaxID=231223 RepID=A0AAE1ARF4_9GAST|nr:hypothetical protein RRG08_017782 [Elysia crispata]
MFRVALWDSGILSHLAICTALVTDPIFGVMGRTKSENQLGQQRAKMDEVPEDENDCNLQVQSSEDALDRKTKPPNKKRFDEEMMDLTSQIKEKEAEMDRLKSSGVLHISKNLNSLRADRTAKITQRKEIDEQLERINNKSLPEKMKQLHQLELSLYYKSEDRINTAIQRLEWNLKAHSYKLSEEKKIVSEIDGLKRSKKTLGQYLTLKQEIGVIRDQQRHMREERDVRVFKLLILS